MIITLVVRNGVYFIPKKMLVVRELSQSNRPTPAASIALALGNVYQCYCCAGHLSQVLF